MRQDTVARAAVALAFACAVSLLALFAGAPALAGDVAVTTTGVSTANNPDFDAVTWSALTCSDGVEPQGDLSPSSTDIVGDLSHPAIYYHWDSNYIYFRFRVDTAPTGPRGFDQYAWVSLMQVPTGDAFQYQYELALNGKGSDDDFGNSGGQQGDTIEIWKNVTAEDIDFSPLFNDPAELRLFAQRNDYSGTGTANTTPLARIAAVTDGSNFGGNADYFLEFAVPVSVLIAKGVITGTSDIAESLFFPATSANSNQYNKDHLPCPFLPYTTLSIVKAVAPTLAPANAPTSIVHMITVTNVGQATAKGVIIGDTVFPSTLTGVTVHVSSDDPTVSFTVISTNPLSVKVPRIPAGRSVSVEIDSAATFACASPAFVNTATAGATNATEVSAQATLSVGAGAPEICDGKDNNCDGQVDEAAGLCDDGNTCNGAETCVAGSCRPGTPMSCASNNPCVTVSCDPARGCVETNKADGSSCNDGNPCTRTDSCQSGVCTGGNPVVCAASDRCHLAGTCNPATGICSNPAQDDGFVCDDGNACTQLDSCQAGACVGASPVACTASDQCHVAGICNTGTGVCSNPPKSNGASCDDGNSCSRTDMCQGGVCTGTNAVTCTASDQCHVAGTCDPATGACSNPTNSDGASCNDGDACTQTDICQSGVCTGGNPVACAASDQCHVAGTCDPATGVCSNPAQADGFACDDGNACTQSDTCQDGACVGASPVTCTASDQCHVAGICNTATGVCSNPTKSNGAGCDDDNACSQTDTCQDGVCTGMNPVVCAASDQCHVAGTCDPATGACSNPMKSDGASCNDGNPCTQTDRCQSGACTGSNPVACTASDQCHVAGTCDSATGACSNPTKSDGASCNDGNACTQTDTCQAGACVGSSPVTCTAADQCHVAGICNTATGVCSNPPQSNGAGCDDGNACSQTDTCQSGVCTGTNPVSCTASDQCHLAGTCDRTTGACSNPPKLNGASCNDGDACTQTDTCQTGVCTGGNLKACTASDQCHVAGTCDPATGACSNPTKSNGASCTDGNACTQTDTCLAGACVGANPVTCTAADQCHVAGICNTATGVCSNPPKSNGAACNDSNACTRTDACQSGVCAGTNPVTCTASDQCHAAGICNTATGLCSDPPKSNGASCTDGNACTSSDTCQSGACTSGPPTNCDDTNVCTDDGCTPATGCWHTPAVGPCNDGDVCTSQDSCSSGSCVGGPPTWPDCSAPHSIGHYKHSCSDPSGDDPITLANVDCVNNWSTFASLTTVAQVCQVLNQSNGKCGQAESQFMAALLNLCKHRLSLGEEIISRCGDNTTVAQSLQEANAILSNPARSDNDCAEAQCESEELDAGTAIAGIIVLYADRADLTIHVRWYPPTGTTAANYILWRRVRGVGSFAIVTTTPNLYYDDTQVVDGTNYEYRVTAVK